MSEKRIDRGETTGRTPAEQPEEGKPRSCTDPWSDGFRFDDPYWDDAFDSWHNPTLRTCCRWG